MTSQPRTANGRATRERILAAATDLIAADGVAGTSLNDVRDRAHVSKSQLYLYFSDRDDLVRAVAQRTCDTVLAVQSDSLAGFTSYAGLERYLTDTVQLQVDRDAIGGCPIGSLAGQLADHDESARLILADGLKEWERRLRRGLRIMLQNGELAPDADPEQLSTQILALLQGGLVLTQARRDPGQLRTAAHAILTLVHAQAQHTPERDGTRRLNHRQDARAAAVSSLPGSRTPVLPPKGKQRPR